MGSTTRAVALTCAVAARAASGGERGGALGWSAVRLPLTLERVYELPPDPQRLRVIRLYLQMQIAAVDAKIQEAEADAAVGAEPGTDAPPPSRGRSRAPARAWRLQSVPDPSGGAGRGVLHRDDCRVPGGGRLNRQEFEVALGMPDVTSCEVCRPEREPTR